MTLSVELAGVSRVFGLVPAVIKVNLRVKSGECLLIRGPNGAGKSTLLRIIGTALSPTTGTGTVLGFDLLRDRPRIRARVDMVGHRTRLYEELTAAENLKFAALLSGLRRADVADTLERVGLADVAHERVRGFSQGMRQRLALGRLLMRDPELVLLDEPYAGLDAEAQSLVDSLIVDYRSRGRTVVMVTHDRSRIELATATVWMQSGRLGDPTPLAASVAGGGDAA